MTWSIEFRSQAPEGNFPCVAFTLIELLVVISIIGVLASLIVPVLPAAKGKAKSIACGSNFKQFGLAFELYAGDHADAIPANRDGEKIPLGETWVEGWLGLPGPDCTNTLFLERSLLGRYVNDPTIWRCPSARPVTVGSITQLRARSVSLNCFMGSPVESPAATTYRKLGDLIRPGPSEAVAFVEENADTINDGSFALQWDFRQAFPSDWLLRDKPGVLHRRGANLAFGDGHVELHRWRDARTIRAPRNDATMPGNLDLLWMQQHATGRER